MTSIMRLMNSSALTAIACFPFYTNLRRLTMEGHVLVRISIGTDTVAADKATDVAVGRRAGRSPASSQQEGAGDQQSNAHSHLQRTPAHRHGHGRRPHHGARLAGLPRCTVLPAQNKTNRWYNSTLGNTTMRQTTSSH